MTKEELKKKVSDAVSANPQKQTEIIEFVSHDFSDGLGQANDKMEFIRKSVQMLNEVFKEVFPETVRSEPVN
jgi:hypothetical protein